jgi:hypothetical protein
MQRRTKEQRLFGAACLHVMLERTRSGGAGRSEIYRATLQDLELTEAEVEVYLATERSAVEAALARGGRREG